MNYNQQHMYELCKKHMHSYVLAEMNDGTQVDGIITGIDDEYVYMAIPIGQDNNMGSHHQHHRPFGFGGFSYGYPGYGYGFGGYPGYGRPRRFSRLVLPLAALTALSVLPWY